MDYDDDVVDDFVSDIFDKNSSTTNPSSSPKTKHQLKKGDEQKKSQSEPENTELNSGPEKADSDPVSKSPELKKKRKEHETPGSEPVNPEIGVETDRLPDPGSNPTPDQLTQFRKRLKNLYSCNYSDLKLDYDDDIVDDFVSEISDSKLSSNIPSNSPGIKTI